ncbi:MAG: PEP-CTERM sorting domain-containing protein, partial [Armatimonadota bacterium]
PGLGFYTSFLAEAPPVNRQWGLENAHLETGTVCGPSPEPVSAVLLLLGLPAAAALRKRRE